MSSIFNPTGNLNISWDASDLPGEVTQNNEISGAMTRCKNLRRDQNGKLITRDGSTKINTTALGKTDIWWIEEMATLGTRYTFAGTSIYEDEVLLTALVTSAQWSAIQYNAFNDTTKQIFALNGTDRKRITSGSDNEWGIAAPTVAPSLGVGSGSGLSGTYNAKYTYVRKIGTAVVSESNPSPAADDGIDLSNGSLAVEYTPPQDGQVTHVRVYRTLTNGSIYYLDSEIAVSSTYAYGYAHDWESTDIYIAGTGYDFTVTDTTHGTENTYTWEETSDPLGGDQGDTDTSSGAPSGGWLDTYRDRPDGHYYP